jgi:hypothetical protein
MNLITAIILIVGILLVIISWLRSELQCPPPKIVYRYIPKHTLDVQFGDENNASVVFDDMFSSNAPWIGGYELGFGKTQVLKKSIEETERFAFLNEELKKLGK